MLLLSLGIILLGAEVFTNGVEWLGKKLNLSEGAVGSILAAVGTALPETMIPVIAILFGPGEEGHDIGIGAILGAPFMLGTLAFFLVGVAAIVFKGRRKNTDFMKVDISTMSRDLSFFLIVYSLAVLAAFLPTHNMKLLVIIFLVGAYGFYVWQTLTREDDLGEDHDLSPLFFSRKSPDPSLNKVLLQVFTALVLIIIGAKVFVGSIEHLAGIIGIPQFVLALIIAPVATELPEKFNSIIWVSKGKDTLALGNITGAMVFQSSLIPALGIALTDWNLTFAAIMSVILALASALVVYLQLKIRKVITPYSLMTGGVFYLIFVVLVVTGVIQ